MTWFYTKSLVVRVLFPAFHVCAFCDSRLSTLSTQFKLSCVLRRKIHSVVCLANKNHSSDEYCWMPCDNNHAKVKHNILWHYALCFGSYFPLTVFRKILFLISVTFELQSLQPAQSQGDLVGLQSSMKCVARVDPENCTWRSRLSNGLTS